MFPIFAFFKVVGVVADTERMSLAQAGQLVLPLAAAKIRCCCFFSATFNLRA
jgi:hypothetical protein